MSETVQSIDRALALLTAIADRPDNLSGLARRADIPTSTTGRLLSTLEQAGTVARGPEGTYRIGPAILAMARAGQAPPLPLDAAARPHLAALADATGEAAGLCLPIGDSIHCVAQVDAPKPVQAEDWTGRSWPLHQGGSGIVVLAGSRPRVLEDYLAAYPGVDPSSLRARVRQAVDNGVSWSHGDYCEGLSSVATAVAGPQGGPIGVLYVYGPSYRFPPSGAAEHLADLLVGHAEQLSAQLGAGP